MGRPRTVICYICQREFGTASIGIHEKQCLKKWHDENNKLPPSQRRPEPVKPQGFGNFSDQGGGGTGEQAIKTTGTDPNLDAYNEAASKAAQSNLVACKRCGRRFAADRVNLHERYCRPPKERKPVYEARKPDFDLNILRQPLKTGQGGPPRVGPPASRTPTPGPSTAPSSSNGFPRCRHCNRTFAPDRIERHEANCHAPPLKTKATSGAERTAGGAGRRAREASPMAEDADGITKCQNCSENMPDDAKFCPNCGTPCQKRCENCAQTLTPGAKFCSKCGKPVQANRNNHTRKDSSKIQSSESGQSAVQVSNEPIKRKISRPFVVCYICGREYGTMSIGIHEPQCLTKWSIQNSRLPANQRLKAPERPTIIANRGGSEELRNYNRAALSTSARNTGVKNSQDIPALFCVKRCTLK